MTSRRIIALCLVIIVLPAVILWIIGGHPTEAHSAPVYATWHTHKDKTYTDIFTGAGIHEFSISQELEWDGGTSNKYPWGRVYNINRASRPWVNANIGWRYDGVVADNSHFDNDRFVYVFDRTYEFHVCFIWYCNYVYPEIRQTAYATGDYRCKHGTDPANLKDC